jgi:hypothetical protein
VELARSTARKGLPPFFFSTLEDIKLALKLCLMFVVQLLNQRPMALAPPFMAWHVLDVLQAKIFHCRRPAE